MLSPNVKTHSLLANFRVHPEEWRMFLTKHNGKASERLRQLIRNDIQQSEGTPRVNRDNLESLKSFIFSNDSPIQFIGSVGVGKSSTIKNLIQQDKDHIYIIFDSHSEYDFLPEIQSIGTDIQQSSRIKMPIQTSASKGLFSVYANQILSQKYPSNFVIVIEEGNKYKEVREVLREARKYVKIIVVLQEELGSFCPKIEVTK